MKAYEYMRAISPVLSVLLIIVLAVWSWQMISYRQQLTEINKEQIEECFYIDCTADFFGNLECREVPMYDNRPMFPVESVKQDES